ncbi:hypothetical protein PHMEG_00026819 [Phytophthora megakarya]|uniref:PiggyBac transposable element-derived protein domain-containing protein n=1 Tax=Phytophthora megakarya TaxID=4795 RepID=A0A225V7J0_9STRA|nr:hypothetical protein PHMEG_00026819 [Phytophthora megakarya]
MDRAWKIRPVVNVLQRTFARGYKPPPIISFDEATLPSRSRYNPTRQFNKDKPHRWGTKYTVEQRPTCRHLFQNTTIVVKRLHYATCMRYCHLIHPWRLVVTDRFYTSVKLALELLHRRMYLTGTIQTDRSRYAQGVVTSKKYKTVNKRKMVVPPQRTIKLAENKDSPRSRQQCGWTETRFTCFQVEAVGRKSKSVSGACIYLFYSPLILSVNAERRINGEVRFLPAPSLVGDYHRSMGGVDVHDQLRMQRYSVQLAYKSRKYYKTLFLGLLDMAIVNAFIVHRHYKNVNNKRPPKHFQFLEELHVQLLAVDSSETFAAIEAATTARERTAPSPSRTKDTQSCAAMATVYVGHRLEENPDTVEGAQGVKKRHRSCKVCALHKSKPRKFTK